MPLDSSSSPDASARTSHLFQARSRLHIIGQGLRKQFRLKNMASAMDGSVEKRPSKSSPISAIFVHAGAGYHSTTNEHIHLGACNE